jgi:hypothetical protein
MAKKKCKKSQQCDSSFANGHAMRVYTFKATKTYEAILQLILNQHDASFAIGHQYSYIIKRTRTYEDILQIRIHQHDNAFYTNQ